MRYTVKLKYRFDEHWNVYPRLTSDQARSLLNDVDLTKIKALEVTEDAPLTTYRTPGGWLDWTDSFLKKAWKDKR